MSWPDYAGYHFEPGLDEERDYAWGEWHGCVENPDTSVRAVIVNKEADDATYTFSDVGAYFRAREDALAAIFRWIQRDLALELQGLNNPVKQ
jgi:hypothetical protein